MNSTTKTEVNWSTQGVALTSEPTNPLQTKTLKELKDWRDKLQISVDNEEGGSSTILLRKKKIQEIEARIKELETL